MECDNKPLEPGAVSRVHGILLNAPALELARSLALQDCALLSIRLDRTYPGLDTLKSGLHLLTLVDGRFLREDVVERALCLRIFVHVSVLTCPNWDQSVRMIAKWIEVAAESSDTFGNLLAFFAVTSALCSKELQSLRTLWRNLARGYETQAKIFDEVLVPKLRKINFLEEDSGSNELVVIPHVIPFLAGCKDLKDRRTFAVLFREIFEDNYSSVALGEKSMDQNGKSGVASISAEAKFKKHLAGMQSHLLAIPDYKRRAEEVLGVTSGAETASPPDEVLQEVMKTEFHLRLLWGSRGCLAGSEERHFKFEKVIGALTGICQKIERTILLEEASQRSKTSSE